MGQYFVIVNKDKREWLHPHRFGEGLKFPEFFSSQCGVLSALALLLRTSSVGVYSDEPLAGSWAGDSIYIAGDYDEGIGSDLYNDAMDSYKDISMDVLKAMVSDPHMRSYVGAKMARHIDSPLVDEEDKALYRNIFKQE